MSTELAKNCDTCSQVIQSKLSKNEDWETKRKAFWEQKLEEGCKCSTPNRGIMHDAHYYSSPQYEDEKKVSLHKCRECEGDLGNIVSNKYGDKRKNDKDKAKKHVSCFAKLLEKKMKEENISSLQIKDNKLIIEYSNGNSSQIISEKDLDSDWREIYYEMLEEVLKEKKLEKLTLSELQIISHDNKPFNWTPWLTGGGIITAIGIIAYFWTKNEKDGKQ